MIHLREVHFPKVPDTIDSYPSNLSLFQQLATIEFPTPITLLVGENGSGKSTLIESIALAAELTTVGNAPLRDQVSEGLSEFSDQLQLVWNNRNRRGFFLRSEDFLGFIRRVDAMKAELMQEAEEIKQDFFGRADHTVQLALSPIIEELNELKQLYGDGLDTMSHGEGFMKLFHQRIRPNGLYILDEPETPLSPQKQVELVHYLREMISADCQLIIATHSPILLAIPEATILHINETHIQQTTYAQLPHIQFLQEFVKNPTKYIPELRYN